MRSNTPFDYAIMPLMGIISGWALSKAIDLNINGQTILIAVGGLFGALLQIYMDRK